MRVPSSFILRENYRAPVMIVLKASAVQSSVTPQKKYLPKARNDKFEYDLLAPADKPFTQPISLWDADVKNSVGRHTEQLPVLEATNGLLDNSEPLTDSQDSTLQTSTTSKS
ncbi:hypothetical protein AVEN_264810-1 [Araneus ventricosus]|uniref:Uncharacterized protein n=1 Tax=Araneus ventricosus TaxID=182803 RepID=A0A4Y2DWW0_ARAVE|nr:hypothetical protein AVEN_264810-1 [Araneus ventricosus]